MPDIQIDILSGYPGGEGYLFLTPKTAVLVDTGYDFSAPAMLAKIQEKLAGRPLDLILLTHSHYDHLNGCAVIQQAYRSATVAAHPRVSAILAKANARKTMRELNEVAAANAGFSYTPTIDQIRIDRDITDGERILLPDMTVRVLETPGHTHCCLSFYFEEYDVIATCESSCILLENRLIPEFVVSYQAALQSIGKCAAIGASRVALSHGVLLEGDDAKEYFDRASAETRSAAELILDLHRKGADHEEILAAFSARYYRGSLPQIQSRQAFELNSNVMIARLIQETEAAAAANG
jgi:Zn-dependent hydrolases, including glyoxylases